MQKPEFALKESICHEIKDGFYNEKKVAMTCYLVYYNISKNDILYNWRLFLSFLKISCFVPTSELAGNLPKNSYKQSAAVVKMPLP